MLTSKQEAFCQAVSGGASQSDAYKSAYSTGRMKPETITNSAYKLMQDGDVTGRLAELRKELAGKGLWSREDSIRAMIEVIGAPDNQGCKISAVKVINEMQGFNAPIKTESKSNATVSHSIAFLDAIQSKLDEARSQ